MICPAHTDRLCFIPSVPATQGVSLANYPNIRDVAQDLPCAHCGARIPADQWRAVVGAAHVCSATCAHERTPSEAEGGLQEATALDHQAALLEVEADDAEDESEYMRREANDLEDKAHQLRERARTLRAVALTRPRPPRQQMPIHPDPPDTPGTPKTPTPPARMSAAVS